MKIIIDNNLTDEGRKIREEIFLDEQKFSTEFDETDDTCLHLILWDNDEPIAVGRMFPGENEGEYVLGRIAVRKPYRGKHYGDAVVIAMENKARELGATKIALDAQCHAEQFYVKHGYTSHGDIHYDEHCPHIAMTKNL